MGVGKVGLCNEEGMYVGIWERSGVWELCREGYMGLGKEWIC